MEGIIESRENQVITRRIKNHEKNQMESRITKWNHETIKKGKHELETGERIIDNFSARGIKRVEERLPNLLNDIKSIVDGEAQTDPTFKTTELFTRLTSKEVRNQLIAQKGYSDEELPTEETIRKRLNELGYSLKKVTKVKPKKKFQRQIKSSKT